MSLWLANSHTHTVAVNTSQLPHNVALRSVTAKCEVLGWGTSLLVAWIPCLRNSNSTKLLESWSNTHSNYMNTQNYCRCIEWHISRKWPRKCQVLEVCSWVFCSHVQFPFLFQVTGRVWNNMVPEDRCISFSAGQPWSLATDLFLCHDQHLVVTCALRPRLT